MTDSKNKIDILEKNFEAWLIQHALKNNLCMHKDDRLKNLLFVNSQWRFELLSEEEKKKLANIKGKQYIDILAFNPAQENFVVIELKKNGAKDWENAKEQAQLYCDKFNAGDFSVFFLKLLKNMVTWYVVDPEKQNNLILQIERLQNNKKLEFKAMAIKPSANINGPEDIFQIDIN